MEKVKPFELYTERYDKWFKKNPFVYLSEMNLIKKLIPQGRGMEIGVGTGRFAKPININIGIDPSLKMGKFALKRDINFLNGFGENLPFRRNIFDYLIFITTICFLKNIKESFKEAYRVLKIKGKIILGFIDKESPLGIGYREKKELNPFYSVAKFYSVDEVVDLMERHGFKKIKIYQTIFRDLNKIHKIEPIKEGSGRGSFISTTGIKL